MRDLPHMIKFIEHFDKEAGNLLENKISHSNRAEV